MGSSDMQHSRMEGRPRILVVEDEPGMAYGLKNNLEVEGYEPLVVESGLRALEEIERFIPHVMLLDLMLPDIDGLEVLSRIRARGIRIPIIVISARVAEHERVAGLDAGADDYVTKPFGIEGLLARIRVQLRKASGIEISDSEPKLRLDDQNRVVYWGGRRVQLARRECQLLRALIDARGGTMTKTRLLGEVWKYSAFAHTRTVDTHIKTLRYKLGVVGCSGIIRTVHGVGYCIDMSKIDPVLHVGRRFSH